MEPITGGSGALCFNRFNDGYWYPGSVPFDTTSCRIRTRPYATPESKQVDIFTSNYACGCAACPNPTGDAAYCLNQVWMKDCPNRKAITINGEPVYPVCLGIEDKVDEESGLQDALNPSFIIQDASSKHLCVANSRLDSRGSSTVTFYLELCNND
jgi:hypothetical protein